MELWLKLALGSLTLVVLAQLVAGSDRALRARRWSPLIYFPLMILGVLRTHGWMDLPAAYVWSWLGVTLMADQLVSELRRDWRNRGSRQPVA